MKNLLTFLLVFVLLTNCKTSRNSGRAIMSGEVQFLVRARVGEMPFSPDSIYYAPGGESFSVSTLKFFISDVALSNAAAKESTPVLEKKQNGIQLVDLSSGSMDTIRMNFPLGEYSDLRFTIGVPRELNHQDPSSAPPPLDLGNDDMFWEWNSGYIFFLLDGKTDGIKEGMLHMAIGNDSRTMPFWFGDLFDRKPLITVNSQKPVEIELDLDLLQLFNNGDSTFYRLNSTKQAIVHNGHQADVLRNNLMQAIRVRVR